MGHKQIYARRKSRGLCVKCGQVDAEGGRVYCEKCRRYHLRKSSAYRLRKAGVVEEVVAMDDFDGYCKVCGWASDKRMCNHCTRLRARYLLRLKGALV